jgi:translation initiation factor 1
MIKKKSRLVYSTRNKANLERDKTPRPIQSLPPSQQNIRVRLDRKRRRGKVVTVAGGFQLNPTDLKALEKTLKQLCGAGGTSKGDEIEIQGDQRDKIIQKLIELNYKAKRAGG